jgi:hypothetical protein
MDDTMNASLARAALLLLTLAATPLVALAATPAACTAHSSATTPHLIELYTSEGCSSCPPAEDWLGGLSDDSLAVALEFHVDYWDALGWPDRFASARWTARQNALAARSANYIVYTPEVALDGREWRQWSRASLPPPAAAAVRLHMEVTPGAALQARLTSLEARSGTPLQAYFAIVENGLTSSIRNGENAGRTLRHANVVRAFAGPAALGERATLQAPPDFVDDNSALIGFVTDAQGAVLGSLKVALRDCH